MALVTSNAGEIKMIQALLNGSPENLVLKLYKNNYTPLATSTAGSFTESTFTGYAAVTLATGSWGTPTTDGAGAAVSSYSAQVFSCTAGSEDCYGYFVVGASTSTLYWGERFATTRTLSAGIDLTLTPSLSGQSAN